MASIPSDACSFEKPGKKLSTETSYILPNSLMGFLKGIIGQNHNIDEIFFESLKNHLIQIYTPVFEDLGYEFEVNMDWNSEFIHADAQFHGENKKERSINISGAFARQKFLTKGALLQIACHEIGHHLGGLPYYKNSASSVESQATYYANLICMRRILDIDRKNELKLNDGLSLPIDVKSKCQIQFQENSENQKICLKSVQASVDLSKFLVNNYKNSGRLQYQNQGRVDILTPSIAITEKTNQFHADVQCTLDTAYQASLCNNNFTNNNNLLYLPTDNETEGVCHYLNGDKTGARPPCWFKSKVNQINETLELYDLSELGLYCSREAEKYCNKVEINMFSQDDLKCLLRIGSRNRGHNIDLFSHPLDRTRCYSKIHLQQSLQRF